MHDRVIADVSHVTAHIFTAMARYPIPSLLLLLALWIWGRVRTHKRSRAKWPGSWR